jgi:hypothetical protein
MTSSNPRQRGAGGLLLIGGLLLTAALFPATASAQSGAPRLEVYGTFGLGQLYLDEGFPDHSEAGGGARWFLTRRFAVQGELLTFRSNIGELPFEYRRIGYVSLVGTWGPTNRTVRPYWLGGILVAGGGHANTAVWLNGGLGARISVGDRYFLAPEVRGPIFRASISAGIALGGE